MAFRERTVTGFVVDADGTPINAGTLSFQLDKPLGYTSTHVVIDRIFTAVTTSLGAFTVTLWCDEDSLVALNYKVSFPVANSGQPQSTHTATISLAYQDGSPKDLGTLIAESQPPPSEVPLATWQALIEDTISAASLNDLSDVVITAVADDQVLTWDSGTSKWVNQAPGGGGGITVGTTTSNGTANTILKTDGAGKVHNAVGLSQGSGKQLVVTSQGATDKPLTIQLAASQSGNALEILPNGSSVPLLLALPDGTGYAFDVGSGSFGRRVRLTDNFANAGIQAVVSQTTAGAADLWLVSDTAAVVMRSQGSIGAQVELSAAAGDTWLKVRDVDNNAVERVTVGATDSGGVGFKVLRIPN